MPKESYQHSTPQSTVQRIARYRKDVPARFRPLFDAVVSGRASRSNSIRLQCAACYGFYLPDSKDCDNVACPFYNLNPYRHTPPKNVGVKAKELTNAAGLDD